MPTRTRSRPTIATASCTSPSSGVRPRSRDASRSNERSSAMNDVDTVRPDTPSTVTRKDRPGYGEAALTPPVDVVEDAAGITLYADLPGVSKEKLHLQVESDTLTIDAESNLSVPEKLQSSHTEVGLARFHRVFTLS